MTELERQLYNALRDVERQLNRLREDLLEERSEHPVLYFVAADVESVNASIRQALAEAQRKD